MYKWNSEELRAALKRNNFRPFVNAEPYIFCSWNSVELSYSASGEPSCSACNVFGERTSNIAFVKCDFEKLQKRAMCGGCGSELERNPSADAPGETAFKRCTCAGARILSAPAVPFLTAPENPKLLCLGYVLGCMSPSKTSEQQSEQQSENYGGEPRDSHSEAERFTEFLANLFETPLSNRELNELAKLGEEETDAALCKILQGFQNRADSRGFRSSPVWRERYKAQICRASRIMSLHFLMAIAAVADSQDAINYLAPADGSENPVELQMAGLAADMLRQHVPSWSVSSFDTYKDSGVRREFFAVPRELMVMLAQMPRWREALRCHFPEEVLNELAPIAPAAD